MLLQSHSRCNLFYGLEACNVELPNSDEAILLGVRVLVEFTATGDINGVTAAKRSCRFFQQSAGRPPHLPHRAWRGTFSRGGVVLVFVVLAATPCCGVPICNQSPSTVTRCDFIAGAYRMLSRTSFNSFFFLLLLLAFYWNNNYHCVFPVAV
ncbi:hypothetical protein TcG_13385 [Trypanosoma cruzi]|nr:hypothetical protein TcG_13385 [Trypanosoma cruzi]